MSAEAKVLPQFLRKLWEILDREDPTIISWGHDGTSVQIHDMTRLDGILCKYFKHGNYSSFQRQFNYFGFNKWTKTQADVCTFSNRKFIRDDRAASYSIKRKNHPENPGSRKRFKATEPNHEDDVFLDTSWIPDLVSPVEPFAHMIEKISPPQATPLELTSANDVADIIFYLDSTSTS